MNIRLPCSMMLLLTCAGCAPAIYSFTAQPNKVCNGGSVALSWSASTDGKLTARPPKGIPSVVPAQGSASVAPSTVVRLHLEVSNLWGSAARDNDIEVLSGRSIEIGQSVADPSATCVGSALSVTATAPAQSWSTTALVDNIASLTGDSHAYHVEHAGVKADLAAGGASTGAFRGTPVVGPWLLSLTLLSGEKCGTPTVPRILGVGLTTTCSPG